MNDNTKPKNPSAFPYADEARNAAEEGMTLRDYFAGQCISNQVWEAAEHSEEIAKRAYKLADALLKQREL